MEIYTKHQQLRLEISGSKLIQFKDADFQNERNEPVSKILKYGSRIPVDLLAEDQGSDSLAHL